MTKCAVGAMLFGGTLGMSQAASAGLVFNLNGPSPWGATDGTFNTAYTAFSNSYVEAYNYSFAATTATLTTGLSASWTATSDSTGFNVNVLAPATQGLESYVQATRSFTVTGSQQITMTWSGSSSIGLTKYNGGSYNNPNNWSQPFTAPGWAMDSFNLYSNSSPSGTFTTTFGAGTYYVFNQLANVQGASFSFAVPAPGALALLGVAGLVGARRRRA
jgi:hypothetical protein